jgi:hypothetical protein
MIRSVGNLSLAGWTRTFVADGLVFTPPEGPRVASIRIRTHVRPLISADAMLDVMRAQMPPVYQLASVDPPARETTLDGEYAIALNAVATAGDNALQRTTAMILGDDFYDLIDAATTVKSQLAAMRQLVSELVQSYALGLGDKRRRRYFYLPPRGWAGIARPRSTVWIPPDYPNNRSSISVFETRSATLTPSAVQDRALWEDMSGSFRQDERKPTHDIVNPYGLAGRVMMLSGRYGDGPRVHVQNVALYNERHVYFVRLESDEANLDANRASLGEIVESIEPLPKPVATSSLVRWADHWAE